MRLLLSLPPSTLAAQSALYRLLPSSYHTFVTSDPDGVHLGSGGGTTWLLESCHRADSPGESFQEWLHQCPLVLVHGGGQSRRLPAYGPCGKIFTPAPVFRWARGQTCEQTLLDTQLPLYEDVMRAAPPHLRTLIACGDVLIQLNQPLPPMPENADVVCYGVQQGVDMLMRHGVFFMPRATPEELDMMLQKPSLAELHECAKGRVYGMDIGLWLLSDRAVEVLRQRSKGEDGSLREYDLYSEFGAAMGKSPRQVDPLIAELRVRVVMLPNARFLHYGTTTELISSTYVVQNAMLNTQDLPQTILRHHPSIFSQNARVRVPFTSEHRDLWIENSEVAAGWSLSNRSVITGVPHNNWRLHIPPSMCVDVVRVEKGFVARPYGFEDAFRGTVSDAKTMFLGAPLSQWLSDRCVNLMTMLTNNTYYSSASPLNSTTDIQFAPLFPFCTTVDDLGLVLRWMINAKEVEGGSKTEAQKAHDIWFAGPRYSANDLNNVANVSAMFAQRESFQREILPIMAAHHDRSPFYQLDLNHTACKFAQWQLPLPPTLSEDEAPVMRRIHHHMFCARVLQCVYTMYQHGKRSSQSRGANTVTASRESLEKSFDSSRKGTHGEEKIGLDEEKALLSMLPLHMRNTFVSDETLYRVYGVSGPTELAALAASEEAMSFKLLQTAILQQLLTSSPRPTPRRSVQDDQIVWARGPARIDLSGGWTDTPPHTILFGGSVVNVAIHLNGQPPLQVYVKPSSTPVITIRSIDLGSVEVVKTYEELRRYDAVGSPFSIPKAALALAGFLPEFGTTPSETLEEQLRTFFAGKGLELTLLVAIPAGSGLGTSSIIAATVLSALSDFCNLGWDACEVGRRTLCLEQLLTTGGGWQDQYGGLLRGLKLLQSTPGFAQNPSARWLPEHLFTDPRYAPCHLLYYTGITRTAKCILAEIVRGMFLNSAAHLRVLEEMRQQTLHLHDALTRGEFERYGRLIACAWDQNKRLDAGTCSPPVAAIIARVEKYVWGMKLAGAGGGGYLYMVAKDADAARHIREELTSQPPNQTARFVEMAIANEGIQVSRS